MIVRPCPISIQQIDSQLIRISASTVPDPGLLSISQLITAVRNSESRRSHPEFE